MFASLMVEAGVRTRSHLHWEWLNAATANDVHSHVEINGGFCTTALRVDTADLTP